MNISQLKSDVDFLCGSTSATYADTDKIRNINIAYQDVARLIWDSEGTWQYDDSNSTTLPIAKTTLVHAQQDYTLPSTAQRILNVSVKDSSGNFWKLQPIDIQDFTLAPSEEFKTPGLPIYYDLIGRSIMLYPAPASGAVTLASGMSVYVDRDVIEFATTASTTIPGFATPFHRILSYAAAIDFTQDSGVKDRLVSQRARLEAGLVKFYSRRAVESPSRIKPASQKRWRQYT
jgi:hypothetical protein